MGAPGFVFESLSAGGRGRLNWRSCGWEEDSDIKDATTSETRRGLSWQEKKKASHVATVLLATVIERHSKKLKWSVMGSSNVMLPNTHPTIDLQLAKLQRFRRSHQLPQKPHVNDAIMASRSQTGCWFVIH